MKALLFGYPLAALVLAACASTPPNLNDDLVVRGKRIGETEIGMPLAMLLAVNGAPVRTAPIPGTDATTYSFPKGLTVGADDKVYWIITEDARFHTDGGVRPGTEQIFARATLGKPRCVENRPDTTMYDYGNIYFEAGNVDGRVKRIGVIAHNRPCPPQ
jgi:hypothetical protein